MTHEDDRRLLKSIPYLDGEIKILIAKKNCLLGNHYHKIKTERFHLIKGECSANINGNKFDMKTGKDYIVNPNDLHSFELQKDSILFCICSHKYNETDDYI